MIKRGIHPREAHPCPDSSCSSQELLAHILTVSLTQNTHGLSLVELKLNGFTQISSLLKRKQKKKPTKKTNSKPKNSQPSPNAFLRPCRHLFISQFPRKAWLRIIFQGSLLPCKVQAREHPWSIPASLFWMNTCPASLGELLMNCSSEQRQFHGSLGATNSAFSAVDKSSYYGTMRNRFVSALASSPSRQKGLWISGISHAGDVWKGERGGQVIPGILSIVLSAPFICC